MGVEENVDNEECPAAGGRDAQADSRGNFGMKFDAESVRLMNCRSAEICRPFEPDRLGEGKGIVSGKTR